MNRDYYACSVAMTDRFIDGKTRSRARLRQFVIRWMRKGGAPLADYSDLRVYECLFMN